MQRFTVTGVLGAHGVTVAAEELTSYVNATIHPPKMEENRAKGLDVRLKSVLLVRFSSVCRSVFSLQKLLSDRKICFQVRLKTILAIAYVFFFVTICFVISCKKSRGSSSIHQNRLYSHHSDCNGKMISKTKILPEHFLSP